MNWLAHLRLAPSEPLVQLGNLAGDFVRGVDLLTLHPEVQRGVVQHRRIDIFVDAHPLVRRSRERLDAPFRRFGGVLVDVYYDHFLARDWASLGDGRPLGDFAASVHSRLREHATLLPPRLREAASAMESEQWLVGYARIDGIRAVLRSMAGRLSRPTPLGQGAEQLRAHYEGLGGDFAAFWPELMAFAAKV